MTAFLGVVALVDMLALGSDLAVYFLTAPGDPGAEESLETAEHLQTVSSNFYALAFLCAAVTFLLWFRRVRLNAEWIRREGWERGRGWAVGAWFIPLANLRLDHSVPDGVFEPQTPAVESLTRRLDHSVPDGVFEPQTPAV
ncbi:DUF4328 domain-containing protein [Streptomyces sp. 12297]